MTFAIGDCAVALVCAPVVINVDEISGINKPYDKKQTSRLYFRDDMDLDYGNCLIFLSRFIAIEMNTCKINDRH